MINGIEDLDGTVLGYIPIGSSNDFARGMGLSTDPVQALKHILSPERFTYINIGTAMYAGKTRRFAVSSGLGFDAGVCHQVYVSKLKKLLNKLHLGKLSYAAVALQQILTMTPLKMTLTLDDNTPIELYKTYFATAEELFRLLTSIHLEKEESVRRCRRGDTFSTVQERAIRLFRDSGRCGLKYDRGRQPDVRHG